MYKDKRSEEDERIRKIITDAYWTQAKRSIKVMIYILIVFFAISGGAIVYRWFF